MTCRRLVPCLAAVAFAVSAGADTLTWTGGGGNKNWSTAANWSSSGSHTVPQNGDRVTVAIGSGCTSEAAAINNDIEGLSLANLTLTMDTGSGDGFIKGKQITLTGGLDAFSSTRKSGGTYLKCYLPLYLSAAAAGGTNKFNVACDRTEFRGAISGPGVWWISGNCMATPCADNSGHTGETYIDNSNWTMDVNASSTGYTFGTGTVYWKRTGTRTYNNVKGDFVLVNNADEDFGSYGNRTYAGSFSSSTTYTHVLSFHNYNANGTLTVNSDITLPCGVVAGSTDGSTSNLVVTLNGQLTVKTLRPYITDLASAKSYMTFNLAHTGNVISNISVCGARYVGGAADSFGGAVVTPGCLDANWGYLDLNGFDQTIDRLVMNGDSTVSALNPYGHVVKNASPTPATLTMKATEDCETDAFFDGRLSLTWDPTGDYAFQTYADFGREMPMEGAITVKRGTFEVNGANSFPNATAITVKNGAFFDWRSTAAMGLRGVRSLVLEGDAQFAVADVPGVTSPFSAAYINAMDLSLGADAALTLPENTKFYVRTLTVDGTPVPAGTIVTSESDVPGTMYVSQIKGAAVQLVVTGTDEFRLSAKAYATEGLVCLLDGIENAGYGTHSDNATVWKDLTGLSGDFTVSNTSAFTENGLYKSKGGGPSAYNMKRRYDIQTVETAVSGLLDATGVIMPIYLRQQQMITIEQLTGKWYMLFDSNHYSYTNLVRRSDTTFTVFYPDCAKASGFLMDGVLPEGYVGGGGQYSDGNNGITLGGRIVSWSSSDCSCYNYTLNSIRLYTRTLSGDAVTNNWIVDEYRYRGNVVAATSTNYRQSPSDPAVLQYRFTVAGEGCTIYVDDEELSGSCWKDFGEPIRLRAVMAAGTTFDRWTIDPDWIVSGAITDPVITIRPTYANEIVASVNAEEFIVTCNTNLTEEVHATSIAFKGPYAVTASGVGRLTLLDTATGITFENCAAGSTVTVACPIEIGSGLGGSRLSIEIPSQVTLHVSGTLTGRTPLLVWGAADSVFKSTGTSPYAADIDVSNVLTRVSGSLMDSGTKLTVKGTGVIRLDDAEIGGILKQSLPTDYAQWFYTEANTVNTIHEGINWTQTPVHGLNLGNGSKLIVEGTPCNNSAAYYGPTGAGELHFTNVTYQATMIGGIDVKNNAPVMHLWSPGSLRIGNHFSFGGKIYSHAENTIVHSPLRLYDNALWDLGGYDQTCGRFSWCETWGVNATIHSAEPATLRVFQDEISGSGSNRGTVEFRSKITGQVSLVKTGNEDSNGTKSSQDLLIGSAITSTGEVSVVWGLLSFTNAVGHVGSWLNATKATAGGTYDAGHTLRSGVLELQHSRVFSKTVDVYVQDGGKVRLLPGVAQTVHDLYLDGNKIPNNQYGTYGSTASSAKYKDDTYFEGTGVLNVIGEGKGTFLFFR